MAVMSRMAAACVLLVAAPALGLENGLARTPPMGWMSWQRFRCVTDCAKYPDDCLNEKLLVQQADALVAKGFAAAGYDSINVDDCYLTRERVNGQLKADPARFPGGMPALGLKLHSMGLKFGMYEDVGTKTCGGYPGLENHTRGDINLMAQEWKIDYLKADGCYSDTSLYPSQYRELGQALLDSGRPISYSCSWPAYLSEAEKVQRYPTIQKECNLWRLYDDVQDSWDSVKGIINYWAKNSVLLAGVAKPGAWNDPDMLIVGGFGLSESESQAQMGMWAIFAAPLFMGNDLRNLKQWQLDILLNRDVIAVNQDPLGKQGTLMLADKSLSVQIWRRALTNGHVAIALHNQCDSCGIPQWMSAPMNVIGFSPNDQLSCTDLFSKEVIAVGAQGLKVRVDNHGIRLFRCFKI